MDDANLSLHKHWIAEMQYLFIDSANQERDDSASLLICYDGWFGHDELGAHHCSPCPMQANQEVLEDSSVRKVLAYPSPDLLDLRSSR